MAEESSWLERIGEATISGIEKRIDAELAPPPPVDYTTQTTRLPGEPLMIDGQPQSAGTISAAGVPLNKVALILGLAALGAVIVMKVAK